MRCNDFFAMHPGEEAHLTWAAATPREHNKQFSIDISPPSIGQCLRIRVDLPLKKRWIPPFKRCDWCFVYCPNEEFLFVELKGEHILTAVEQIRESIVHFRREYGISCKKTRAFVVSGGLPRAANQRFQRLQEEFVRDKMGVSLNKQTNVGHYRP